jgi:hypothetical protein
LTLDVPTATNPVDVISVDGVCSVYKGTISLEIADNTPWLITTMLW